jgi:hypothetical protein
MDVYWFDDGREAAERLRRRRVEYAQRLRVKYPHLNKYEIKRITERKVGY